MLLVDFYKGAPDLVRFQEPWDQEHSYLDKLKVRCAPGPAEIPPFPLASWVMGREVPSTLTSSAAPEVRLLWLWGFWVDSMPGPPAKREAACWGAVLQERGPGAHCTPTPWTSIWVWWLVWGWLTFLGICSAARPRFAGRGSVNVGFLLKTKWGDCGGWGEVTSWNVSPGSRGGAAG